MRVANRDRNRAILIHRDQMHISAVYVTSLETSTPLMSARIVSTSSLYIISKIIPSQKRARVINTKQQNTPGTENNKFACCLNESTRGFSGVTFK